MDYFHSRRYFLILTGLIWALVILSIITMCLGRYSMNPLDVLRVFKEIITGSTPLDDAMHDVLCYPNSRFT